MIVRNSILTTFRARGRTILFFFLIFLLTLSLTLGLGMYASSHETLTAMDRQYISAAFVEYMGEDYPDKDTLDMGARDAKEQIDAQSLIEIPGVLSWEWTDDCLAALENYQRVDGVIPYEGRAVVEAVGFSPVNESNGQRLYSARIVRELYNQKDVGTMVMVDAGETDFAPEAGISYLIHGQFIDSGTGNATLTLIPFDTGETPFYPLSGEDDPALSDSIFTQKAAYYEKANNYVRVRASETLKALEEFHQGILTLSSGRLPVAGETGVCAVDGQMARQMGLSLGDKVHLDFFDSDENDRFLFSENTSGKTLTIVGITSSSEEWAGNVWVSESEGGFNQPFYGFRLGVAVLDNSLARQAADQLQMLMPEGVAVTLYDQGYFAASQPIQAVETMALAIAVASVGTGVAVLVLFGILFVGRQQETVHVLQSLGTPLRKIRLWLLWGSGMIAAAAALAGAVAGHFLMKKITRFALSSAQSFYWTDQRYSESSMGSILSLPELEHTPFWPKIIAPAAVLFTALLFCILFLSRALNHDAPKHGKQTVYLPRGKTSIRGRGILRYSLMFAIRSRGRSAAIALAAMILTVFIGSLFALSQGWQAQIQNLYDSSNIRGKVTSTNGRVFSNLLVSGENIRLLWKSGMLSQLDASVSWHYWFEDERPVKGMSGESESNWIARQPTVTALNSFFAAPAFYYKEDMEICWLDGWNESCFFKYEAFPVFKSRNSLEINSYTQDGEISYPCMVSEDFLMEHDLNLGDTFAVQVKIPLLDEYYPIQVQFTAVGSCDQNGEKGIYVPMCFWTLPSTFLGEDGFLPNGDPLPAYWDSTMDEYTYYFMKTNFSTCRFTLTSPWDLDKFRDYLARNNVSQAGKLDTNRLTVVLEDQTFMETAGGLMRLIRFFRILFPALIAALCLLGFVISWLATGSRHMEFAILQGLGTPRGRVFLIFFLDQGIVCLVGSIMGGLVLSVSGCSPRSLAATGIFFVCYMAGCSLSVLLTGQTNLMELLSEKM